MGAILHSLGVDIINRLISSHGQGLVNWHKAYPLVRGLVRARHKLKISPYWRLSGQIGWEEKRVLQLGF